MHPPTHGRFFGECRKHWGGVKREYVKICESKPERKTEVGRTKMILSEETKKDLRELEVKSSTRQDKTRHVEGPTTEHV
jgi:hypothetical protein